MKTDSVVSGGAAIVLARVIGMGCAFLLFVMLARQSNQEAGVFRSVVTFIVIAEFLGMLGTQRWLAVALGPAGARRRELFVASIALAVAASAVIILIYLGVSFTGAYGPFVTRGLRLAALAVLPSALLTVVQTTLVGVGVSRSMGILNLFESVIRSGIGMGCVLFGMHALSVIVVFVACRWLVMSIGMMMVIRHLPGMDWRLQRAVLSELVHQVPRFVLIMIGFLITRNAALVLLPALVDTREAGDFAVPYQLYDLALLVPTILALSSNFIFVTRAAQSPGALRWAVAQLWSLTSVFLLPITMVSLVFGGDLLHTIFGQRYNGSILSLYLLMLGAPLMALDQVLSQTMQSAKLFREDTVSVLVGASVVLVGTIVLGRAWGASGAAFSLLLSLFAILTSRFVQLRNLIDARVMLALGRNALNASLLAGGIFWIMRHSMFQSLDQPSVWKWGPMAILALVVYLVLLRQFGGLKASKRGRVRQFLLSRHHGAH